MDERAPDAGDAHAVVAGVVSEYETPLLRYVTQLLGRGAQSEAEDVVQETFLRYYREVSRDGQAVRSASAWLFRVAHNQAMDALRRKARQERNDSRPPEPPPAPADALEGLMKSERSALALAELNALPDDLRQVLLLRVVQGMKLREICDVTGLTVGNAGYRIGRALDELTRRLKARGVI